MRIAIMSISLILVHSATFITAIPLIASYVIPRHQLRAITPLTIAGTIFAHGSPATASLGSRHGTQTVRWDAPNSQTYVILTINGALPENIIRPMLNVASVYVQQALLRLGDRVIEAGRVDYRGPFSMAFQTWNTNNHQQTYGVLGAAIAALRDYMEENGYGAASFVIFDGVNEVGKGVMGPEG